MTCAVTASVACWLGTNSTVAMCGSFPSADAREGVSDEHVHHPPPAESGLHEHHSRRLRLHLADLGRALAARDGAQRGERARRASGATKATSTPSFATYIGSMPEDLAGPGDRRVARELAPRARRTATPEARASSLSTDATPPRVASRMHRSEPAGRAEQRVDGGPERARVGLDRGCELELAAGEHDRRAVLADRPGDEDPVAGPERRGRERGAPVDAGRARSCRCTSSRSGRARRPSCRRRRPGRPPPRAAARDRVDLRSQLVCGEPLLEDRARPSARAGARRRPRGRSPCR